MAPRTYRKRTYRKWGLKRYKTPSTSTKYFRVKVDILQDIHKIPTNPVYQWGTTNNHLLSINSQLLSNDNFVNCCKQFTYVRIKAVSYLATPDIRNQSLSASGFVGMTVWPRAFDESFTNNLKKCADNQYFRMLNPNQYTYKYCNILGGDNEWKPTSTDRFCWITLYPVTNFDGGLDPGNAPLWQVKISVYCVFKSPIQ